MQSTIIQYSMYDGH